MERLRMDFVTHKIDKIKCVNDTCAVLDNKKRTATTTTNKNLSK